MKKSLVLLLSTGWIFILFLSLYFTTAFLRAEVSPIIYNTKQQLNSFPFLHEAQTMLTISFIWFVLVLIAWTVYFIKQK